MFASSFVSALLFATASAITYEGTGPSFSDSSGQTYVSTNYKYQIDIVQDNGRIKH